MKNYTNDPRAVLLMLAYVAILWAFFLVAAASLYKGIGPVEVVTGPLSMYSIADIFMIGVIALILRIMFTRLVLKPVFLWIYRDRRKAESEKRKAFEERVRRHQMATEEHYEMEAKEVHKAMAEITATHEAGARSN